MPIVYNITSERQFDKFASKKDIVTVMNFWAKWAEPCQQMNEVIMELSTKFPSLTYINVEVDEFPNIVTKMKVDSVPSFLIVQENKVLDKIEGAKAAELSNLVSKYAASQNKPSINNDNELEFRLRDLIYRDYIMVFMKGVPEKPRCGFSKQVIELLDGLNVKYSTFNILSDEQVRQGLKVFSDWPTYPQIYVKGELIGGLDLLKEMIQSGEFQQMIANLK
ncbi:thioredoxin-like protein [Cokeromyces recurvatus]|uniref:thioredoxin-like protein n=1 Tax=Cokeromyces recurvatus TaxID=90255 RepID=UPI00221E8640|nr:thioredoxin-like protein [Cokeromyces recurvatus]KAI7902466.1 thioredoxin-like protein [Cokeromyces recurvatus]